MGRTEPAVPRGAAGRAWGRQGPGEGAGGAGGAAGAARGPHSPGGPWRGSGGPTTITKLCPKWPPSPARPGAGGGGARARAGRGRARGRDTPPGSPSLPPPRPPRLPPHQSEAVAGTVPVTACRKLQQTTRPRRLSAISAGQVGGRRAAGGLGICSLPVEGLSDAAVPEDFLQSALLLRRGSVPQAGEERVAPLPDRPRPSG